MPSTTEIKDESLAIVTLNVGDGDAVVVRFPPAHGPKTGAVVDCYKGDKTIAAIQALGITKLNFVCATHPHYDHTAGMSKLIKWCLQNGVEICEFWDSGFRHVSKTHYNLIRLLEQNPKIKVFYPTSGFETIINKVRVLVLSPSMYLKNRYDTFGTNINNASVVLKLEYPVRDIAKYYLKEEAASDAELEEVESIKQNTVILGGDAQFDAWAQITQEFPELVHTDNRGQMIDPKKKSFKPLRCQVFKVPHHMSKHGATLQVVETLLPRYTIASCDSDSEYGFPHELAVMAVEELRKSATDKGIRYTGHPDADLSGGTIVAVLNGGSTKPKIVSLGESVSDDAPISTII
jgi:beta-lactamase superfamily II metal-dependent hydrolase